MNTMFGIETTSDKIVNFLFGLIPWICAVALVIGLCEFLNIVGGIPYSIIVGLIILAVVMVIGIRKIIKQYNRDFGRD